MTSLLQTMGPWHWLLFGVALFIGELLMPGTFLVWMGLGATLVGALLLLAPTLPWQFQWLLFAVVSVSSVILWRRFRQRHPEKNDHPLLNQRGRAYVGRHFTLKDAIVDGVGKLHVDDTQWKISGQDMPAGTAVEVIGVDGTMLKVRATSHHGGDATPD